MRKILISMLTLAMIYMIGSSFALDVKPDATVMNTTISTDVMFNAIPMMADELMYEVIFFGIVPIANVTKVYTINTEFATDYANYRASGLYSGFKSRNKKISDITWGPWTSYRSWEVISEIQK